MGPDRSEARRRRRRSILVLLRGGLVVAVTLMSLGFLASVASGDMTAHVVRISDLPAGGIDLGDRLMGLGVFVLALTPAGGVLALLLLWLKERDWRFAGVAAGVTVLLVVAALVGHG